MNFLTFDSFISIPVLIAFYYVGALMIPALIWYKHTWVVKIADALMRTFPITTSRLVLGFMILFVGFEIMWRMMFEMLFGSFKMIEYLHHLAS